MVWALKVLVSGTDDVGINNDHPKPLGMA